MEILLEKSNPSSNSQGHPNRSLDYTKLFDAYFRLSPTEQALAQYNITLMQGQEVISSAEKRGPMITEEDPEKRASG